MKNYILFLYIVFLYSCATSQPPPSKYRARFDFIPAKRNNPNSAGVTIALINPVFGSKDHTEFSTAPYSRFIKNMANDFEEMLIAKGFSLRGPFNSRDEMVYGDKKNSNFALEVKVSLENEGSLTLERTAAWAKSLNKNAPDYHKVSGSFEHVGSLILEITDPFSGEKFWKKTVSLPRKIINCQGYEVFRGKPTLSEALKDVGVYNPIAKALEQYYTDALQTASRHISIEEMKMVAKEVKKAQEK